jgi:hypothetical protein
MATIGRVRRFLRWDETEYWQVWVVAFLQGAIFFGAYAFSGHIVAAVLFGALIIAIWGIGRSIKLKSRRDLRVVQDWTPPRS